MRRLMITVMMVLCTLNAKADETTPTPILSSINDIGIYVIDVRDDLIRTAVELIPFLKIPNDVPKREVKCLADNIYFEAKNEPYEGKLAVAQVTINRVEHPEYPKTVCGVVWQQSKDRRTGRRVAQFSWTLDGRSDTPKSKDAYAAAYAVAEEVLLYDMQSAIVGTDALFYHANYVKPRWARKMERIARIGNHIFYRS